MYKEITLRRYYSDVTDDTFLLQEVFIHNNEWLEVLLEHGYVIFSIEKAKLSRGCDYFTLGQQVIRAYELGVKSGNHNREDK